jgi:hypothetical protein
MSLTNDSTLAYLCNIPLPSTIEASQDTITITIAISGLATGKQSQKAQLKRLKIQNEHLEIQTEETIKEHDLYEMKLHALSSIMAEFDRESPHFSKEITLLLGDLEMLLIYSAKIYSCWRNHCWRIHIALNNSGGAFTDHCSSWVKATPGGDTRGGQRLNRSKPPKRRS